jgi:16S rRNA (adenine1518-N6/adenine1519-N6)-dimethyltransferase
VVRLGQNFLADTNLLGAIVREAEVGPEDVVLEVGGGEGVLTARVAPLASAVHVIELDERLRPDLDAIASEHGNVQLHFADAMRAELGALDPQPTRMVANLPYAIATPLIIRTITDLPRIASWTLMVQREIADRLRAQPWTRAYGSPSVIVQLACEVRMLRSVDRAVFTPRPRVDSALIGLRRTGPAPSPEVAALVRDAFAHRRKSLARSLEHARPGVREAAREALVALGLAADARAEQLAPQQFVALADALGVSA